MRHVLIITGGTIDSRFAFDYISENEFDYIICADHGLAFCKEYMLIPNLIIGDFDSVDEKVFGYYNAFIPERIKRFPSEKDETDTELALLEAIEFGADTVTIIGGTGSRLDHVMGNIQLLKMALDAGVKAYLVDANNRIQLICRAAAIRKDKQFGKYVSVIPFTPEVKGINIKGAAYPVEDFTLVSGISRGLSNQITDDVMQIMIGEGMALVIESRD